MLSFHFHFKGTNISRRDFFLSLSLDVFLRDIQCRDSFFSTILSFHCGFEPFQRFRIIACHGSNFKHGHGLYNGLCQLIRTSRNGNAKGCLQKKASPLTKFSCRLKVRWINQSFPSCLKQFGVGVEHEGVEASHGHAEIPSHGTVFDEAHLLASLWIWQSHFGPIQRCLGCREGWRPDTSLGEGAFHPGLSQDSLVNALQFDVFGGTVLAGGRIQLGLFNGLFFLGVFSCRLFSSGSGIIILVLIISPSSVIERKVHRVLLFGALALLLGQKRQLLRAQLLGFRNFLAGLANIFRTRGNAQENVEMSTIGIQFGRQILGIVHLSTSASVSCGILVGVETLR
mmetsp:Transcript_12149/g.22049  ORF Transcript_12149/g.22049 Transcript_12149/m.22049 type:complete len:341 (-) Transcript_12149:201-1223(-)